MTDGQIMYTRQGSSGVVLVNTNANFTMTGGIISNNTIPSGNGGGVRVDSGAIFLMDGGLITNNTFNGGSAGVFNNLGTFRFINGAISNNTHVGPQTTWGGAGV